MKDFIGNNLSVYKTTTGNGTFTAAWTGVRSMDIEVPKGKYVAVFKYSVPFSEGTYYARIFCNNTELVYETKVANPYYNLKGTLTGVVEVSGDSTFFCDIGVAQASAVGKQVFWDLRVVKVG
jgi:hypothetical protein